MRRSHMRYPGRYSLFTPSGLIARATVVSFAFIILHAVGFRTYTTILSGTSPTGEPFGYIDSLKAVAYIISYLFATVGAPILVIAALVLAILQRMLIRSE